MKKLYIFICFIFLVGCWDQKPLRESRLAYSLGYDSYKNKSLKQTVEIVHMNSKLTNEVHSAIKNTAQDTTDKMRTNTTGDISYIKYGLQLYGKALEKKGIFPTLDVAFRDPGNPTSLVKLVSVDGLSSEILEKKKIGKLMIGEFLKKKVNTLEERSYFPVENLESVFKKILDKGEDFTLPSIKIQGKEIVTNGLALFHNDKLTGRLPLDQCVLFTLLKGKVGEKAHITKKINGKDYVSVEVKKGQVKREMNVITDKSGNVHVTIKLKLLVTVLEYPRGHLGQAKEKKKVSKQLSKELTDESKKIINKLQKVNCDAFGVGRQLIAYHPKAWKKFDYKKAQFDTKVDVIIFGSGILN
ncbi:Ger(x)C family spore germination protein [Bacillus paramycoides]|uniref:Ger(X)C family spore germination protein n=1 Tax=Bacillus paramycoides TaxID=2026194 RepID=A0ABU6MYS5_9BACI|nr:Ger(x)C family spore germination protein [Bacillus paramycoides]MED1567861.1 Ger(x)C family spore germination protein [Bacillus paramycoides]